MGKSSISKWQELIVAALDSVLGHHQWDVPSSKLNLPLILKVYLYYSSYEN